MARLHTSSIRSLRLFLASSMFWPDLNTSIIPLVDYNEEDEYSTTTTTGIIECSVNKRTHSANVQIEKYIEIFESATNISVSTLFVNGGKDISKYPTINIDIDDLVDSFSSPDIENKLSDFIESML